MIYAGTDTGKLWKTSDAGENWTQMTPTGPADALGERDHRRPCRLAITPRHVLGLPRGRQGREHLETKNGGASWTNISGNLPNAPLDAVVLDTADDVVIVSGDLGVYFLRKSRDDPNSIGVDATRDEPAEHVGAGHQDPGLDEHALRDDVRPRCADDPAAAAVRVGWLPVAQRWSRRR